MARQPRFEYPGAVYHVMARGDGGKTIFEGKDDHESFLHWLDRTCVSHGWLIHAWVLMGNHFHLLFVARFVAETGLPLASVKLAALRKGDPRKVLCAALVKSRTTVPNEWLASRLAIGHPASMSKHVHRLRRDPAEQKEFQKYEKMLKSKDWYHFIGGFPARPAAMLQAGFPTLGLGGKVFKTKIDLGGGNPYDDPNYIPYSFY